MTVLRDYMLCVDMMRQFGVVALVVCVFVLLSVSLHVESRRRRRIPRVCRPFISLYQTQTQTQTHRLANDTQVDDDDDDDDDGDIESDEYAGEDDEMKVAVEEINMLKLMIDFMGYVLHSITKAVTCTTSLYAIYTNIISARLDDNVI